MKVGDRVRLIKMVDDPRPIEPGSEGTIEHIDDIGQIHVDWDNGRKLALIPGVDEYTIIEKTMENLKYFNDFEK